MHDHDMVKLSPGQMQFRSGIANKTLIRYKIHAFNAVGCSVVEMVCLTDGSTVESHHSPCSSFLGTPYQPQ